MFPIWRFALHLVFVTLAAQRGTAAFVLHTVEQHRGLVIGYALQAALAAWVAIALWIERFEVGGLVALGIVALATSVFAGVAGTMAASIALSQAIVTIVTAGGLAYVVWRAKQGERTQPPEGPHHPPGGQQHPPHA